MKQPYNPTLWNLYSTCRYLRHYKPPHDVAERKINDYVKVEGFWLKGGFDTIRDFIAVDDETNDGETVKSDNPNTPDLLWAKHPRMAVVGIDVENVSGKQLYSIPVEWIPRLAVREDGLFVLKPFEFCCREILVRSKTQLVRCQSLTISNKYYVDKHYFHVGSGDCDEDSSEIEVFAATHLYVGLKSIMRHFATGLYVNMGEMLMALDCNEENLNYYHKEVSREESTTTVIYTVIKKKGMFIRKYLAHIVVCKNCIRYLEDFLTLLDQSVENHPFPSHDELDCDGYNYLGLPIFRYILDADFDSLAAKAYYGVIDGQLNTGCDYVDAFMNTYAIKHV
ncbi:Hypothetical predicted protein [Paramuricea clavata]|uniref:Uncharacterized protein n=1 Tax=Paramuricea clavata TaxID=317549 RepID=A0A7D9IJU8_PARCT|nr:Hypothetical predicted protein [Paramuricea clavata]